MNKSTPNRYRLIFILIPTTFLGITNSSILAKEHSIPKSEIFAIADRELIPKQEKISNAGNAYAELGYLAVKHHDIYDELESNLSSYSTERLQAKELSKLSDLRHDTLRLRSQVLDLSSKQFQLPLTEEYNLLVISKIGDLVQTLIRLDTIDTYHFRPDSREIRDRFRPYINLLSMITKSNTPFTQSISLYAWKELVRQIGFLIQADLLEKEDARVLLDAIDSHTTNSGNLVESIKYGYVQFDLVAIKKMDIDFKERSSKWMSRHYQHLFDIEETASKLSALKKEEISQIKSIQMDHAAFFGEDHWFNKYISSNLDFQTLALTSQRFDLNPFAAELSAFFYMMLSDNPRNVLGKILLKILAHGTMDRAKDSIREILEIRLDLLACALQQYQSEHKSLPSTVQHLVSEGFIGRIPENFFTPQHLEYSAEFKQLKWTDGKDPYADIRASMAWYRDF